MIKQIKREMKMNYRWWNEEGEIKEEHISQLETLAIQHIQTQISEGILTGELNTIIEEIEYNGWWKVKITNINEEG
jgi:hypothetical protein